MLKICRKGESFAILLGEALIKTDNYETDASVSLHTGFIKTIIHM